MTDGLKCQQRILGLGKNIIQLPSLTLFFMLEMFFALPRFQKLETNEVFES